MQRPACSATRPACPWHPPALLLSRGPPPAAPRAAASLARPRTSRGVPALAPAGTEPRPAAQRPAPGGSCLHRAHALGMAGALLPRVPALAGRAFAARHAGREGRARVFAAKEVLGGGMTSRVAGARAESGVQRAGRVRRAIPRARRQVSPRGEPRRACLSARASRGGPLAPSRQASGGRGMQPDESVGCPALVKFYFGCILSRAPLSVAPRSPQGRGGAVPRRAAVVARPANPARVAGGGGAARYRVGPA